MTRLKWRSLGVALAIALSTFALPVRGAPAPAVGISETLLTAPSVGAPGLEPDGVYLPDSIDTSRTVPVLLALHGYSGSGPGIAARLRDCADANGWLLVAPTMVYRDYFDPQQLRVDARENLPRVRALIDAVRNSVRGLTLAPQLLVYGFSRGAQMAHRFSMFYPGDVAAVATLSAGSYTLPDSSDNAHFPFGLGDVTDIGPPFDATAFDAIPFWVGVGGADTNPADTSRAWDALEGQTRVDRARAFTSALATLGNPVELHVFGGAGHEETAVMRANACAFLADHLAN